MLSESVVVDFNNIRLSCIFQQPVSLPIS